MAAPESICLSPADLRRRVTPTGITDVVDELYERWSFVFLGFGLDDPDFRLVSQRLLGANIAGLEHFLIYPGEPGFEAQLVGAEQGLTPVPTSGTLEEVVHALGEAWNAVAAEARPPEDDLESWLEIWGRDTGDEESRAVLRRAEDRLRDGQGVGAAGRAAPEPGRAPRGVAGRAGRAAARGRPRLRRRDGGAGARVRRRC